jgi:AbiV family abortive infection protein
MAASVTSEYLLEGAAYALEQCGLLLRDANVLYRNGSSANAVVLVAFAQEELGRYRILLDLRRKVLDGDRLTIKDIQDRCKGHVRKQEASMRSFVITDPALGKLLDTYLNANSDSEEWKAAKGILELDDSPIPVARHKQRLSALYVDATTPDRWNRPTSEISRMLALLCLRDAARDYSLQYNRYTLGLGDPELYSALKT